MRWFQREKKVRTHRWIIERYEPGVFYRYRVWLRCETCGRGYMEEGDELEAIVRHRQRYDVEPCHVHETQNAA